MREARGQQEIRGANDILLHEEKNRGTNYKVKKSKQRARTKCPINKSRISTYSKLSKSINENRVNRKIRRDTEGILGFGLPSKNLNKQSETSVCRRRESRLRRHPRRPSSTIFGKNRTEMRRWDRK